MFASDQPSFDVIIIGGSYAGLSAALTLGRALRRVLVLDADAPANRFTPHAHNLLTRDGEAPHVLRAAAQEQLRSYSSVTLLTDTVTQAGGAMGAFRVATTQGNQYTARYLLLATGVVDELPPLPGFAECWGRTVLHCPFCHGFEVHGRPWGVLANGQQGYDAVKRFRNWTRDLTLFTNGPSTLPDTQLAEFAALGIRVEPTPVAGLAHHAGELQAVKLVDGRALEAIALFVHLPSRPATDLTTQLSCQLTEAGLIDVKFGGQTSVPGVFAAGDNMSPLRQLTVANTNGLLAASMMCHGLFENDWQQALATA